MLLCRICDVQELEPGLCKSKLICHAFDLKETLIPPSTLFLSWGAQKNVCTYDDPSAFKSKAAAPKELQD